MTSQKIKFSANWPVSNFVTLLSKQCNDFPPPFIISKNFSPFGHILIDAYIELRFEKFNDDYWSSISAYVNFKSYISQPIPVTFKICFWDGNSRVAKGKGKNITLVN